MALVALLAAADESESREKLHTDVEAYAREVIEDWGTRGCTDPTKGMPATPSTVTMVNHRIAAACLCGLMYAWSAN